MRYVERKPEVDVVIREFRHYSKHHHNDTVVQRSLGRYIPSPKTTAPPSQQAQTIWEDLLATKHDDTARMNLLPRNTKL